jgi:hypothetical protein
MPQIVYGAAWLVGGLVAFPCYVLIMQHLSGNLQLSIMIMIAIFVMQYALWPHVHPIARIFTSIGFVIVIDAENHQSYSMVNYLQTMLWMATSIAVTLVVRFAFFPRRPDTTFLGLLNQFFRHADFLLSAYDAEGRPDRSLGRRWRSIFYRHSILGLADKMALYAGQADFRTGQLTYKMLRGATPEQMQELIRAVFALGHRIEALVEARKAWQSNAVDQHVMAEKREWLQAMHEWFRLRPGAAQVMGPDEDLQAWLAKLETRIDEAFERIEDGELSTEDYENPRWQEMRF